MNTSNKHLFIFELKDNTTGIGYRNSICGSAFSLTGTAIFEFLIKKEEYLIDLSDEDIIGELIYSFEIIYYVCIYS